MTKEEIKEFVQEWMNSHEQDTFIKNEHGVVLYSSGHTSLNLTCFFEDLLTDFIESENEMLKVDREWISVETKLPKFDELVIWRGLVTWNSKNPIRIFSDEMTMEQETLEYGEQAYLLKNETDYVVCRNPNVQEFTDQFVTHWMPLPQPPK